MIITTNGYKLNISFLVGFMFDEASLISGLLVLSKIVYVIYCDQIVWFISYW